VLIGGPPCQGVSISGHRLKEDARNELFSSYLRILSELKPEAFVMENVPGLIGLFNGELIRLRGFI
jgi:DNA (cytosine-5)-methyltransferase 1